MRNLLVIACLVVSLGSGSLQAQTRVLLVGAEPDHPFGSHMYMHTYGMLAKCLQLTEGVETVISDDAMPLLQVTVKDQPVVVGWAYERAGGGRSYATTLGHYYRNFQQESFRRMIVNAILWSAHRDVPQSGAPVAIGEAALAPPPAPAAP